VATTTTSRRLAAIARLSHGGLPVDRFLTEIGRVVAGVSPYDGCCWMTFDPATFLPTGHIPERSIRDEDVPRLAINEYEEEDVNKFSFLAAQEPPVGIHSEATAGRREDSARYRAILSPNGFENELRVTFLEDTRPWGGAAFYRKPDSPDFDADQATFVAAAAPHIAEGLRRSILVSSIPIEATEDAPGLILFDRDNTVESMTSSAEHWISELREGPYNEGGEVPNILHALAARTRHIVDGDEEAVQLARARMRTPSGRWLVMHGSMLGDGRAAVIVEPARPPEIAPLIVDAYELSERERDVTQLVLQGLSTKEIGATLHLSPYTVQDHLKAIFEKVGVRSRRELVARVFFEHYAPRMSRGENLASSGWFAPDA
jgi:DNA-binding CsgD family transcriptional regulator